MDGNPKIVSVLVDLGFDKALDYAIPPTLTQPLKRGMQVKVPLRGREETGYILEVKERSDVAKILPIHSLVSEVELLTDELFELALWLAKYYNASLRQVLKCMLPASIRHAFSHKEPYFVRKLVPKEKLRAACLEIREKFPSQARV